MFLEQGRSLPEGQWVSRPVSWYATEYLYCRACGAMLHSDYWIEVGRERHPYCSPQCRALELRVAFLYERSIGPGVPSGGEP